MLAPDNVKNAALPVLTPDDLTIGELLGALAAHGASPLDFAYDGSHAG